MVFNPNSRESCEYYCREYKGDKQRLIARNDDYTGDYHPNQSRDYALSNTVKCECTQCHVNKNGYCEVPSLINISSGGKCRTGEACMEARKKR